MLRTGCFRAFFAPASFSRRILTSSASLLCSRSSDPIEQLYQEKLQEYHNKSSGGKMVEPTEEILKQLEEDLTNVAKNYGAKDKAELETFPDFKFTEPKLDSLDLDEDRYGIKAKLKKRLAKEAQRSGGGSSKKSEEAGDEDDGDEKK